MLELESGSLFAVACEERKEDVRPRRQRFQQRAHARQHVARMAGFGKRLAQPLEISIAESTPILRR